MAVFNPFTSRFPAVFMTRAVYIFTGALFILISQLSISWCGAASGSFSKDLTSMSIEDLMNIEVTSVSRKVESIANAAAAVFVISQEDIRRSGGNSIPDVLRMVPGLDVARIDANKQAISSRGFNGRFSRKMLVLIDGRTVYTPLFSGVFWDRQDMMLEDIERIEVIRGPGATLWGANAVNGVINIITKKASDTLGGIVTAGSGNVDLANGGVRYGVKLGTNTNLRVYTKYLNMANSADSTGRNASDGWNAMRGGFRMDSQLTGKDALNLQGDMYGGRLGETYTIPSLTPPYSRTFDYKSKDFEGNILSRWQHTVSESSDLALQLYYDRSDQIFAIMGEKRDTFDLDFQYRFNIGKRQGIVWGMGYRYTHDQIDNTPTLTFSPDSRGDNLFSAFVQDDITIVADMLRLTLGSKFEHNDYTGFEVQPNIRAIWTPNDRNSIWGAVSRAVRIPSRAESDIVLQYQTLPPAPPILPLPLLMEVNGSNDLRAETLLAYELGYRVKLKDTISFDLSTFYNEYNHLSSQGISLPVPNDKDHPQYLIYRITINDKKVAESYGAEVAADWAANTLWRFHVAYSFLELKNHLKEGTVDFAMMGRLDPRHQFSICSQMDLGHKVELDLWLRYVDALPGLNIKSYITPDVRLGWKPWKNIELSLTGQNLTHHHRLEFRPEMVSTQPTETERTFFAKITKSF